MTDTNPGDTKVDHSKASKHTLYCSFCGKSQHEVRKLIAGPTVFICDECVDLCHNIIRDEHRDVRPLGDIIPEYALELLENLPVDSVDDLLKDGGLRATSETEPYTAREVVDALIEGVDRARTRADMTPERAKAIEDAIAAFNTLSTKAQAEYDRDIKPLRDRIEALKRGEPLDTPEEVTKLPEPTPRLEPVPGLETATLTQSSEGAPD